MPRVSVMLSGVGGNALEDGEEDDVGRTIWLGKVMDS